MRWSYRVKAPPHFGYVIQDAGQDTVFECGSPEITQMLCAVLNGYEAKIEKLRKERDEAHSKTLMNERDLARGAAEALEKELGVWKSEFDRVEAESRRHKKERDETRKEIADLKVQIDMLRKGQGIIGDGARELAFKLSQAENSANFLRDRLDRVSRALSRSEQESMLVREERDAYLAGLRDLEFRLRELTTAASGILSQGEV